MDKKEYYKNYRLKNEKNLKEYQRNYYKKNKKQKEESEKKRDRNKK